MQKENVRALLHKLVKQCAVKKVAYGKYTVFPAFEPAAAPRCIDELHPRRVRLKD